MSFLNKLRETLNTFMQGRHGADEFSMALLIGGVVLSILYSVTHFSLFFLISLAAYIFGLYRMLSRDHEKRYAENQKYLAFIHGELKQFYVRMKNIRKFKYFKCPQCQARLRLPRKVGEVTVTCGKCRHTFKQKA